MHSSEKLKRILENQIRDSETLLVRVIFAFVDRLVPLDETTLWKRPVIIEIDLQTGCVYSKSEKAQQFLDCRA